MQKPDFLKGRKGITFVDLFAGAGGFSEGFMQAYTDKNYYDFILASDINENCELTHRVRYNKMLGLDTEFICQDIMEESFLPNLLKKLKNKTIDVVTGGPSWLPSGFPMTDRPHQCRDFQDSGQASCTGPVSLPSSICQCPQASHQRRAQTRASGI